MIIDKHSIIMTAVLTNPDQVTVTVSRHDEDTVHITYQFSESNCVTEVVKCGIGTPLELPTDSIQTLIIDGMYNKFIAITVTAIELSRLSSSIESLTITGCHITTDTGCPILSGMSRLRSITVRDCRVDDVHILDSISEVKTLRSIELRRLYSWYISEDPDRLDLSECDELTELLVEGVSMKHMPLLPKSIRKCSINQYYTYARITGGLNMINWSDYTNLEYLRIVHTNLRGTIPKSICEAAALQYLDLSRNQLRGHIPSTIQKLSRLQCLNLSRNYLRGSPPYQIRFS